jgi:hypothetical protein
MPITGRDKKAYPRDVIMSLPDKPKRLPAKRETFEAYAVRGLGQDIVVDLLIRLAEDDKDNLNQRRYMQALDNAIDELYRVRAELNKLWPKG